MECVVDSSFALAWALPDERSSRADRIMDRLAAEDRFWVPALWWYEVANVLLIQSLALAHGLSAYDASCLELAIRKDLPLATLDKPLTKAAKEAGLTSPI
ncbi:type II toxin-antitoxin system VapC family toxin [Nitrospira moscoviensis]|uniref:Putative nucleic acid-binding protein n=1 Tax=Nitrospira moscoviensis TaxID=42253 RepID=A0A0K2GF86_NITMO|nr:type II toxin-antitoxin system VapC family toxin [Nitrospira moscoviensis]ALA59616.1 putative nucleic acid-binding protein [Nitrospira moscoviensis]